ncbi:replication/maintenance protein RepL [Vibrio vulnificus]
MTKQKAVVTRYDHNPFTENMLIQPKNIRLSKLGVDDNVLIDNQNSVGTHVTTYKKVDADKFVKLFTANIALTFELKASGVKAFNVLMWAYQHSKLNAGISSDLVPLDKIVLDEFLEFHKDNEPPIKLSLPTFWRGLAELEKAKIVAKNIRQGWYYINPNLAFNGDRIAFTTLIERESNSGSKIEP